jgi:polar amino acid transport system permease protein
MKPAAGAVKLRHMHSLTVIVQALPYILQGTAVTVAAVALALGMGLVFGVPFAMAQVYGHPLLKKLVALYVWFFRGVPILVLLFLFYGFFISIAFMVDPFLISCLVMGCTSTAYQSQIFRGAIESLPSGQMKAARALGMRDGQAIASIILPQAMRLSIPGWANEFSILLKDSAVCYVLGTQDIMARTAAVAARTHEHLALYATTGVIYFILTIIVLKLLRRLETKMQIPGYSTGAGFDSGAMA